MALRYRIGTKIFALAVVLLLLTVVLSSFGAWKTNELHSVLDRIADVYIPLHEVLDDVDTYGFKHQLDFEQLLGLITNPSSDPQELQTTREDLTDHDSRVQNAIAEADALIAANLQNGPDGSELLRIRGLLSEVKRDSEMLRHFQDRILDSRNLKNAGVEKELRRLHGELRLNLEGRRNDMEEAIGALVDKASQEAKRRQKSLVAITLSATAVGVAFGLLLAWLVTKRMVQPVHNLMIGVQNVERGDLSVLLPVQSTDEIGALTGYFNRLVEELRSKQRMKETFGKYIDPRIVEKVILNPGAAETEGGRRVMTISFCDLVGFAGIGEHLSPSGLVRMLNRHFELVAGAIHDHEGVVDKFMGDAVMAFWGPPFSASGDHATLACRSALAQIEVVATLRAELPDLTGLRRDIPALDLRIGLASGDVVVGNIGAENARAYTVIGDTVNLASRLESVNRLYGTRILLSGETRRLAADAIEVREVDLLAVKGKTEPAVVYELLGLKGDVAQNRLTARDRYEEALAAYRKFDWAAAETALRGVLEVAPGDGPATLLLSRIPHLQAAPPGADWDGVWHLAEK